MDDSGEGDVAGMWRTAGSLPSFSRGFDMFLPASGADATDSGADDGFFVPSYLASSTYVQKLREAHRSRLKAQQESKRPVSNGKTQTTPTFPQQPLPSGSHRGLSHNVVERPPAFEDDDDTMPPLPTRWNRDDMWTGIDVLSDGLSVKFTGPKNAHEREHEASAVRADHYMPPQCGIYYFEVCILFAKRDE